MFLVQRYPATGLRRFLRRHKIATMPELKGVLGTDVEMTVFRKLRELGYRTSYSHGSRYYTLNEIVDFDAQGLWSHREVWFSQHGTLLRTLVALVERSRSGAFANELRERLHVSVKESLLRLVRHEQLAREEVSGLYLYCSVDTDKRRKQVASRLALESTTLREAGAGVLPDELKAAIVLFVGLLDEKERRLYAGLESLKQGRGGDRQIAALLGIHPQTVARGRRELQAHDVEVERTRRAGAGRKRVEKKHPKRLRVSRR
jgi:hypothetical protein